MKDAYSFDVDEAAADRTYQAMYEAYSRIFQRCGLRFKSVEADTGPIGGSYSHEFMVLAETGEDVVVSCTACDYAANLEKAEILPPPPPNPLPSPLPLELVATPEARTIQEVAAFLKVAPPQICKTLIYQTDQGPVAVVLRGDHEVNEVKLKNFLRVQDLALADAATIRQLTGADPGFTGPVGLTIPLYADYALQQGTAWVVGANRDGYHYLNFSYGRDAAITAFADLRQATPGDPCPRCGGVLEFLRGIEVGHIFKLGYKYSQAMKATYLDAQGQERYIYMGCYGIGVSRIVAAAIEQNHDADGIIFPMPIAPCQVFLVPINLNDAATRETAEKLYEELTAAGLEVLYDDRDERPGIKFKDGDLLGIPLRVVIGPKTLAQGAAEVKQRRHREVELVPLTRLLAYLQELIRAAMHPIS